MRHPLRILSIEDDPKDTKLIQDLLETEGVVCEVTRVDTEAALLASVEQGGIDLILADYSLPSFDGISALKFVMKACPDVPFIFVSGTLGEEVAIEALKIGATDYVLKTHLSRLVPSVLRALREATQRAERKRAEEALRQSEAYLAEAQRLNRTGSFGWNVASGEIYWSAETYKIFEYDRAIKPTLELAFRRIHPDDRDLVQQTIDRAAEARANLDFEHRLLMPDGSVKYLYVLARAVEISPGTLEYVGAVTDVTAAKQAENTLRESEAYLAEAQRLSHTGSWALRPAMGEIRYLSEECCRVLGFDLHGGQPRYETFFQRIHPDDQAKVREAVETAGRERAEFELDYRIVHAGGQIRDIHLVGHPVLSPSGDLVEFVGTVMDVTERKRAEEALRRSEAYLAEAQRLTHTGSWACHAFTGELIHSSEEHSRLYGFDPESGIPTFEECIHRIHPEDRARVLQAFESASHAGRDFDAHFRVVLPDGTTKYVYGTGHPVFNPSGDVGEFVGILIDVTERRRADEERERLRQVQADLAHLSRVTTMGELTASLAHEIKQPISAAATNAQTCLRWLGRDQPDVAEARDAASRMVNDVTRAADIISRISSLFKKGALQRELVDVNELIREMIVLLRSEANRFFISIRTELAEDIPRVMADRVQLQQVFMNLMLNGIDAMKGTNGRGELTIKSEAGDAQLLISVSDTGVGLPPERADQIFRAFFTTKDNGTGMGLPISRSIIESHGGRLWAAGASGRGATFQFTLPAKVAAHI
jgi:PAS domain S-box-containing protein